MIGRTLAHYKITRLLGKGGMGEVYGAEDSKLQREVALKVLPPHVAADPDRRGRFEREALAVAALNHPNIVTIHNIEEVPDTENPGAVIPFLVMELVDGELLSESTPGDGFSIERFFDIALPLTDALASAHERGITHRDLKPANVMIDSAGRVKVLDFGLAKLFEPAAPGARPADDETSALEIAPTLAAAPAHETAEGHVLGTAYYMAPEQAEGKPVDAGTDVFSLGIVFYEMLTGRRPFEGDTSISVISSILKDQPASVHEIKTALPRHLGRIVGRCLAKDPAKRYPSARELREELRALKEEIDSGDYATSEHPIMTTQDEDAINLRLELQRRRNPSRNYLLMSMGMVVVAVAVYLMIQLVGGRLGGGPASAATGPVGVVGFENVADPADEERLGRMLSGLVTTYLAEAGGIEVVSMSAMTSAIREVAGDDGGGFDPSRAAETARRAGAGVMVVGQITRLGGKHGLTAEVVDVARGTTLGSMSYQATSTDEFFDLAGRMAEEVRRQVTPADDSETSGGDAATPVLDLGEALTDDPNAYRHYVAGEIALHQRRWRSSVEHLDRAIEADPSFALAYYRKAMAIWWEGDHPEAVITLETGQPHVARLPERWRLMYEALSLYLSPDRESDALAALLDLTERHPDMPDAWYLLGEVHIHSGESPDPVRAKECFETAFVLDPNYHVLLFHLVDLQLRAGEMSRAESVLEHFRGAVSDDPSYIDSELGVLFAQGKYEEAIRLGERARGEGKLETWLRLSSVYVITGQRDKALALAEDVLGEETGFNLGLRGANYGALLILDGRHSRGLAEMHAGSELTIEYGGLGSVSGGLRTRRADMLDFLDREEEALAYARETTERMPRWSRGHLQLTVLLLQNDRMEEAGRVVAGLEALAAETESLYDRSRLDLARGYLALARGDTEGAMNHLEVVRRYPGVLRTRASEGILEGRIHLESGDPVRAARAFARSRAPGNLGTFGSIGHWARVLYELGLAQEEAGDYDAARGAYREFLDAWGESDTPFPRRDEVAERLAALEQGS